MKNQESYNFRDNLHRLIFHTLHKKLSEKEFLYDDEIRLIILQIFKEQLINAEINIINNELIEIIFNNKSYKVNIQNWIDSIKVLYTQYIEYFHK